MMLILLALGAAITCVVIGEYVWAGSIFSGLIVLFGLPLVIGYFRLGGGESAARAVQEMTEEEREQFANSNMNIWLVITAVLGLLALAYLKWGR